MRDPVSRAGGSGSGTVLVVEDDAELRSAIRRYLTEESFDVQEAADGDEALGVLLEPTHHGTAGSVDAVVLDLLLPRLNGREVCYRLRQAGCWVPVLIATAYGEVEDRIQGFHDGADDYLVKPFSLAELVVRLRAILRRAVGGGEGQLAVGTLRLDSVGRRAWSGEVGISLSPREQEVLAYFMHRAGIVLSREVVRRGVWGDDATVSSNSVDQHIAHLRRKLRGLSAMVGIETVQGVGYCLRVKR